VSETKGKGGHRAGVGYSIPAAAAAAGIPYKTLRRAIQLGQVKTVNFGGLERVTAGEVERIKALFADAA
jgi:hypothetical protein